MARRPSGLHGDPRLTLLRGVLDFSAGPGPNHHANHQHPRIIMEASAGDPEFPSASGPGAGSGPGGYSAVQY